jgi:hypothetical protein
MRGIAQLEPNETETAVTIFLTQGLMGGRPTQTPAP